MSIFSTLFAGFGCCILLIEAFRLYRVHRWPRARGTITKVHFDVKYDEGYHYNTTVDYSYAVKHRQYTGKTRLITFSTFKWLAECVASDYSIGQPVDVAYLPRNPARGILADDSQRRMRIEPVVYAIIM